MRFPRYDDHIVLLRPHHPSPITYPCPKDGPPSPSRFSSSVVQSPDLPLQILPTCGRRVVPLTSCVRRIAVRELSSSPCCCCFAALSGAARLSPSHSLHRVGVRLVTNEVPRCCSPSERASAHGHGLRRASHHATLDQAGTQYIHPRIWFHYILNLIICSQHLWTNNQNIKLQASGRRRHCDSPVARPTPENTQQAFFFERSKRAPSLPYRRHKGFEPSCGTPLTLERLMGRGLFHRQV